MSKKKNEEYWKFTMEYTDIHEDNFIKTLQLIFNYVNSNIGINYNPKIYKELQKKVYDINNKQDDRSLRKSINQFVKLGFINFKLSSCHINTKDFLEAKSNEERNSIFTEIFLSNSSFNRSLVKVNSNKSEINFILKTLQKVNTLDKSDINALMTVNIEEESKGYVTRNELNKYKAKAIESKFSKRKATQTGHLFTFLKKLDNLEDINQTIRLKKDDVTILGDESEDEIKKRDPNLHRLYKKQLQEESILFLQETKCMVEKLAYPVLIASHIKPFIDCIENPDEAYDPNNGILLSRNIDTLFDLGYISFTDKGEILFANQLKQDVKNSIINFSLDERFINTKRIKYLEYHRNNVFEKRHNRS